MDARISDRFVLAELYRYINPIGTCIGLWLTSDYSDVNDADIFDIEPRLSFSEKKNEPFMKLHFYTNFYIFHNFFPHFFIKINL